MSGKHYVFDDNKSKQEAMTKAEIETEIESAALDKYSTSDITIGEWIDGSPIKRRVISRLTLSDFTYDSTNKKYSYSDSQPLAPDYRVLKCYASVAGSESVTMSYKNLFYTFPLKIESSVGLETYFIASFDCATQLSNITNIALIIEYVDLS